MDLTSEQIAQFDRELSAVKEPADLQYPLGTLASALGFEGFVLGARIPWRSPVPVQIIITSLRKEWNELYDDREFLANDPLIEKVLWSVTPFTFDECDFMSHPKARELREISWEWGYRHGIGIPLHGPNATTGLLILVRRDPPITDNRFERHKLYASAQLYAAMLFDRLLELGTDQFLKRISGNPPLSKREQEVLAYSALGKKAKEIAHELDITARTVGFHLARAVAKLGVKTVKNAIAKAAVDGKLCIVSYPATMREGAALISTVSIPRIVMREGGVVREIGEAEDVEVAK